MAEDSSPSGATAPPSAAPSTATVPTAAPAPADTGVTRTDSAPGPEALPGEPLTTDQKGKATVRTRWPVDAFDSGVDGVPVITAAGIEVGPSKVDALLKAAASAGTQLEVVS
jgi:hypothetical protein